MNNQTTNKFFSDLFKFKNEEDEIKHEAVMISLQFISELNKVLEERKITKKKLASDVNISASYVTQLFNGDKKVSCEILARFQKELGIRYKISAIAEELAAHGNINNSTWREEQFNNFLQRFDDPKGALIYVNDVWSGTSICKSGIQWGEYKKTKSGPISIEKNKIPLAI